MKPTGMLGRACPRVTDANCAFVEVMLVDLQKFSLMIVHISLVAKPKIADLCSTNPVLYAPFAMLIRYK